jgi:hypothetical protein
VLISDFDRFLPDVSMLYTGVYYCRPQISAGQMLVEQFRDSLMAKFPSSAAWSGARIRAACMVSDFMS